MKKSIILIILIALFLTSCTRQETKKVPLAQDKNVAAKDTDKDKDVSESVSVNNINNINGVVLEGNNNINISSYESMGFKTVVLSTDGIRNFNRPYKTNNTALRSLRKNISIIRKSNMDYIIDITSGPGFTSDGKNITLFNNRSEAVYFAKMAKEIIKRYIPDKHFKGISINIKSPDIPESKYYSTLNFITTRVRSAYPKVLMVYNLHPISFENGFNNVPKIKYSNIIVNSEIYLKGISYPGYGAGYKNSIDLDRNSILKMLKKLKGIEESQKNPVLITLKTPWAKNSDVLLQDVFEITRTLGFDCSICYGNSNDLYDFSKNPDIPKVVKRHSI